MKPSNVGKISKKKTKKRTKSAKYYGKKAFIDVCPWVYRFNSKWWKVVTIFCFVLNSVCCRSILFVSEGGVELELYWYLTMLSAYFIIMIIITLNFFFVSFYCCCCCCAQAHRLCINWIDDNDKNIELVWKGLVHRGERKKNRIRNSNITSYHIWHGIAYDSMVRFTTCCVFITIFALRFRNNSLIKYKTTYSHKCKCTNTHTHTYGDKHVRQ